EAETGWTAVLIGEGLVTPDRAVREARLGMTAYRRAFREALRLLHGAPGVPLFDIVEAEIAGAPTSAIALAWPDVTILERMHPDVAAFAAAFGLAAEQVDTIFQVAMAIEAGDEATTAALVAAWNAEVDP